MHFHEVRFPAALSVGSSGGPERKTEIVELRNGFEERNSPWAHSRRRFDAGLGVRSLDELAEVVAFFEARHGQLYGFRWKDWTDYKSGLPSSAPSPLDQKLGEGDGEKVRYPLKKSYASGAFRYDRPVNKPVADTVLVAVDLVTLHPARYTVDVATGDVILGAAPAAGATVTAGFEFDVPVRFATDRISTSLTGFAAGEIPSIPVLELRLK